MLKITRCIIIVINVVVVVQSVGNIKYFSLGDTNIMVPLVGAPKDTVNPSFDPKHQSLLVLRICLFTLSLSVK